ncbi:stage II sporulation protein D [Candidatus Planktophila lacus]|jgi:SpoIID/LytB domain protein|uniref:SpoIID/LytB domain-containing protein n=1 Tax=Candidatus Planktophila lacus TaxID=1884913 RepID=UPI000BACA7E8|nr:SpoIID/LytB domain-containing protein [Candidatus Planktophila lacus]ASY29357.1 stage II sporulation protein D [Candidatus Planktophila lacus]
MSKKPLIALAISIAVSPITFLPNAANAETVPATFAFQGSGYGHGVGMSQIGARAKALAGESATAILQYYYTGTIVETVTDTQILRINLGNLLTSAKLRSDSKGAELQLFAGDLGETQTATPLLTFPSKTSLNLNLTDGLLAISTTRGTTSKAITTGSAFTLRWSGTRYQAGSPTVISLTTNGATKKYRHGQISLKVIRDKTLGKRLAIINSVRLQDEYLWGIGEVPSSWPTQALEAQAIASRTYAYAKSTKIRSACDCHLYATISDQTFAGYSKESEPRFGEIWKAAVNRTAGSIITYEGRPITAYFSSSSGGTTETSEHAWGTATPYTVSVPDSASVDVALNPRFASWTREISQAVIAQAFALPDVISLTVLSNNPAGSVALIQAISSDGSFAVLRGETFRSRSKLPSAWFSVN